MTPYLIVLAALSGFVIFDYLNSKLLKLFGMFVSYCLLLVLVGLRDQTGSDWLFYADHYQQLLTGSVSKYYSFDIGYEFFAAIFAWAGMNYAAFLFSFTAVYLAFFFYSFKKLKSPNLAVLFFYSVFLIGFMGTSRQLMALSIISLAFVYLIEGNKWRYIVLIFVASLFHRASLIMLLGLILPSTGPALSRRTLILVGCFGGVAVLNTELLFDLMLRLGSFSEVITSKLMDYVLNDDQMPAFYVESQMVVILMFAKRIATFLILLFLYKKNANHKIIRLSFQFYCISLIVFFVLYSLLPAVAVRLSFNFAFFELFAFASVVVLNKRFIIVAIFLPALILNGFFSTLNGVDADLLVPYRGVLFDSGVERVLR
jgi:hypothetical protein